MTVPYGVGHALRDFIKCVEAALNPQGLSTFVYAHDYILLGKQIYAHSVFEREASVSVSHCFTVKIIISHSLTPLSGNTSANWALVFSAVPLALLKIRDFPCHVTAQHLRPVHDLQKPCQLQNHYLLLKITGKTAVAYYHQEGRDCLRLSVWSNSEV